jgi:hypothetical protein
LEVTYTPVPVICHGQIMNAVTNSENYEVFIHKSPNDSIMSSIRASAIHHPGMAGNYKKGDYVKVSVMFNFENGVQNKFVGPSMAGTSHIIGLYDERSIVNEKIENPLNSHDDGTVSFVNKHNGSGVSVEKSGAARVAAGSIYNVLKPFGYGSTKDLNQILAQNHVRIIANNGPYYLSKEHFGLYFGSDLDDQVSRKEDEDFPIIYRRFVTQTMLDENWVSTCEGTFAPWFGPNNNFDYVEKSKDVLFTKIINRDKYRVTFEAGESPTSMINLRLDKVIQPEKVMTTGKHGASPALLGNQFSLVIDEDGLIDIRGGGQGKTIPSGNNHGFHLSITSSGDLTIHSKGKIVLSHGDSDESNNSITLDPKKGVDIIAENGFRVNGKELVNSEFLKWMETNQAALCLCTAIGAPAPISPAALPAFQSGVLDTGGIVKFTTKKKGSPASGVIKDDVSFSST